MKIDIHQIAYHRNGVGGVGFYAVTFRDKDEKREMVASVFPLEDGQTWNGMVSVFDINLLGKGEITFGENSWRGDRYEPSLREAIAVYEKERNERDVIAEESYVK